MFRYYLVDLILGLRLKNGLSKGFIAGWWKPLNWITASTLAHTYTDPRVMMIQYDKEFKTAVDTGVFKKLLTDKEATTIIERHNALQKKLHQLAVREVETRQKQQITTAPAVVRVGAVTCERLYSH